jgi:hypothetical protein
MGQNWRNHKTVSILTGIFVKPLLCFVISSPIRFADWDVSSTSLCRLEVTMSKPIDLSLEQQFNIRTFETQVNQMSREQAQEFLVNMYRQMLVRENMYKEFLRHEWGIGA